jgi:DNA adenine methylase
MKYMGSKNRLSKELAPIIQSYVDKGCSGYLEPFVGGANMIDKIKCEKRYGSDNNKYLIELFKNLDKINELPDVITREHYSDVRNSYNKKDGLYEDWYIGMVGFFASYNGRFFDGGYGALIKTKDGKETNSYQNNLKNISRQIENLKLVKFNYISFQDINTNISNYVIYCDPPYRDTKQYTTSKDFPYEEFYNWCRQMSENNIVLISEYYMPDDFECIWSKDVKVGMDSNRKSNDDKNKRVEKLFIYKGEI